MANKRAGRGTVLFGLVVLLAGSAARSCCTCSRNSATTTRSATWHGRRSAATRPCRSATPGRSTCTSSTTGHLDAARRRLRHDHRRVLPRRRRSAGRGDRRWSDGDGHEIELDRLDDEFTYSLDDVVRRDAPRASRDRDRPATTCVTVESSRRRRLRRRVGRDPGDAGGHDARSAARRLGVAGIVLGLGLVLLGVRRAPASAARRDGVHRRAAWPVERADCRPRLR